MKNRQIHRVPVPLVAQQQPNIIAPCPAKGPHLECEQQEESGFYTFTRCCPVCHGYGMVRVDPRALNNLTSLFQEADSGQPEAETHPN